MTNSWQCECTTAWTRFSRRKLNLLFLGGGVRGRRDRASVRLLSRWSLRDAKGGLPRGLAVQHRTYKQADSRRDCCRGEKRRRRERTRPVQSGRPQDRVSSAPGVRLALVCVLVCRLPI
jgi:hypothetical protein